MRRLWIADLQGGAGYGVSGAPLLVHANGDDLAECCSIGDVIEIVGFISQAAVGDDRGSGGGNGGAAGAMQMEASSIAAVAPHALWRLPGPQPDAALEAASAAAHGPLAALVRLFDAALQYSSDPHVALALLLSAAAGPGGGRTASGARQQHQQRSVRNQINVMVLHDDAAPQTPRLVRAAALLLSPQVSFLPLGQAEQLLPTLQRQAGPGGAAGGGEAAAFASALGIANRGIAVVDTSALTAKTKKQLAEVLPMAVSEHPT
jgi:hypothetical protein